MDNDGRQMPERESLIRGADAALDRTPTPRQLVDNPRPLADAQPLTSSTSSGTHGEAGEPRSNSAVRIIKIHINSARSRFRVGAFKKPTR
jgi:hypothetical protein